MIDTVPAVQGRTRRRPRFRAVSVVEARRLTPRMVAVALAGELEGFEIAAPTQHIKILIPTAGQRSVTLPEVGPDGPIWPTEGPRPIMRTYTPRRFDPATGVLEVHFVIHGDGPASTWAQDATPGDGLAIAGPGGRLPLALDEGPWVIAGDESALPAIGTLLDALPAHAAAQVYVEAHEPVDGFDLALNKASVLHVLPSLATAGSGARLAAALRVAPIGTDTNVWVGCEAGAVRGIRRGLLESSAVRPERLVTRGYWQAGEADHTDHDNGDDAELADRRR